MIELEKRLNGIQDDIVSCEIAIGEKLLGSDLSVAETISGYDGFRALAEQKQMLAGKIDEIQKLSEQSLLLCSEMDALKKQAAELSGSWNGLFQSLGCALADAPDATYSRELEPYREPLAELRKKDIDAKAALESLRVQMEGQSFMNRLLTQVQYTARNTTVSQMEKKLNQLYIKCGHDIFESGVLAGLYESGSLNAAVSAAYAPCAELKRRVDENKLLQDDCSSRMDENNQQLKNIGVNSSGSIDKRIQSIQQEIEQKSVAQKELCRQAGHDFSMKYIDPDGECLIPHKDVVDKEIVQQLDKIAVYRCAAVTCRRKIQIISVTERIENNTRKRESLQRLITDNTEKINKLSDQNAELEQKIQEAEKERDVLLVKRNELEVADSRDTCRITDTGE